MQLSKNDLIIIKYIKDSIITNKKIFKLFSHYKQNGLSFREII